MSAVSTCTWTGKSGKQYLYHVYKLPADFDPNQAGNYIYAKLNENNAWIPIYIGEGELCDRCGPNHHRAGCISAKGASHFHCHLNVDQDARCAEERDLLARFTNAYAPAGCNQKIGG